MKSNTIEKTLEEILKIDSEAIIKENEKQTLKKKISKELLDERRKVERKYLKEARKSVKIEKENILNEMNKTIANINENSEKEIERLKYLLDNNIDEITGKIFDKILKNI